MDYVSISAELDYNLENAISRGLSFDSIVEDVAEEMGIQTKIKEAISDTYDEAKESIRYAVEREDWDDVEHMVDDCKSLSTLMSEAERGY